LAIDRYYVVVNMISRQRTNLASINCANRQPFLGREKSAERQIRSELFFSDNFNVIYCQR
jgi:hypothetical protein